MENLLMETPIFSPLIFVGLGVLLLIMASRNKQRRRKPLLPFKDYGKKLEDLPRPLASAKTENQSVDTIWK